MARKLVFGTLTCMGRRTVTGMLTASGSQYLDWTTAYRLFSKNRIDTGKIFEILTQHATNELEPSSEIVVSMDDTIIKKTGRKVSGTSWRRDALGPKFHTNFIWGQRFLQISMSLPDSGLCSQARGIPLVFQHCPSVKRPIKNASIDEKKAFLEQKKKQKLSIQGSKCLNEFRETLDRQGCQNRTIHACVDGSYTNKEVLKNLPDRVILIGRIRKDTKLYCLPNTNINVGRKRVYGEKLPTPEEIRQSDNYPWREVTAWAAGKKHKFEVKIVKDIRWRPAGERHTMQLVVIKPLGYRLTKKSKTLYRDPAYLICTDKELEIEKLLQYYLWRWEIEVNFREEKTMLGCGEAQVRCAASVESVPSFIVSIYSMLHLAARNASKFHSIELSRALWYPKKKNKRTTTGDLLAYVKAQMCCKAAGTDFSGFVDQHVRSRSQRNHEDAWISATCFCRN